MRTSNNTVLITGGGSGIGLELAKAFARQNNRVIICGRNREKLEVARRQVPTLEAKECDLASRNDREKLVAWMLERFQDVNILVNNAGVAHYLELTQDKFDLDLAEQELATDLYAPIDLTLRLLPHFRRQPHAAVVNVSTGLVYSPDASTPFYSAAKVGLHTWTRILRYQLRGTGVKVFEVFPPIVDTDMIKQLQIETSDAVPPAEIAEAVMNGIADDHEEIRIGPTKSLYVLSSIAPNAMFRSVNRRIQKMRESSTRERQPRKAA